MATHCDTGERNQKYALPAASTSRVVTLRNDVQVDPGFVAIQTSTRSPAHAGDIFACQVMYEPTEVAFEAVV